MESSSDLFESAATSHPTPWSMTDSDRDSFENPDADGTQEDDSSGSDYPGPDPDGEG